MKVAIDTGPLHGRQTGIGVAVRNLYDKLGQDDRVSLQPYVLSFRAALRPGETRLPLPARLATRLWTHTRWPSAQRWLGDADLIHGTNYVAPPTTLPTLISVYDCWFLEHSDSANDDVRRAGAILRRAVDAGAWVHTSSDASRQKIEFLLHTDRVRTVHLGPIADLATPETTPPNCAGLVGTKFVLAVGTTEVRKRHPWLVNLAPQLRNDVHLVIAGASGDDSSVLKEAVSALPTDTRKRVHCLGPVDHGTKSWLLAHAIAMAYPSMDEGFGFPILEAQLAGLPLAASDVGSMSEVGGDGLVLIDRDDADAFAEALNSLVEPSDERRQLIEKGRANVDRFSWERCASEMITLYEEVRSNS